MGKKRLPCDFKSTLLTHTDSTDVDTPNCEPLHDNCRAFASRPTA